MNIKILGPGCANCTALEKRTLEAIDLSGIDADVEKVTDYSAIASYGVMSTPALVVDEQLVVYGRVPKTAEIQSLLSGAQSGRGRR
ncbi:MAG: TM0996/MTH895 family glutaredoxin-like protein [Acidimicrobiia bacterium]|nr:TM0996/MTH895 family glutaredoxin-like protein [Acidimicrobiia bacterium]